MKIMKKGIALKAEQLAEIITLVGSVSQCWLSMVGLSVVNPWDISFCRKSISILATINSPDTDAQFERLSNSELESYQGMDYAL